MQNIIKLDAKDKQLLFQLNCNSRQSLSDLSRKVGLGRDLVSYRVNRLEEEGVITKYTTALNPYRLGFTLFKTYLRLRNSPQRVAQLKNALRNHTRVFCIADCHGSWDVLFNTLAESPFSFHSIQEQFLGKFHDIILASNVSTVVNHWYYPKKYLYNGELCAFHIGGDPVKVNCDEYELQIIEILSNDSKASLSSMADRMSLSPIAVKNRIERLQKTGVILGFRTELDRSKLGLTYFKARIWHEDNRRQDFSKLFDYAYQAKEIAYLIEQIGDCKIELAIEVQDLSAFNIALDKIKLKFPMLIGSTETILIQNDLYRWLPLGVFSAK